MFNNQPADGHSAKGGRYTRTAPPRVTSTNRRPNSPGLQHPTTTVPLALRAPLRTTDRVAYTRRPSVPRSSAKAAKDRSAKGGLKPRTRSGHRSQHRPTTFRRSVHGAYSVHQPLKTMNPGLASRVHSGEHGLFSRSDRHRSRAALRAARTQVHDHA